jgi:hypothetical protein
MAETFETYEIPELRPKTYYTLGEEITGVIYKNEIEGQIGLKHSDIEEILGFKVPGIEQTLYFLEKDGEIKSKNGMYMSTWKELNGDFQ